MNYVRWSRFVCGIAAGLVAAVWLNHHIDLCGEAEKAFLSGCGGAVAGALGWAQTFNVEAVVRGAVRLVAGGGEGM